MIKYKTSKIKSVILRTLVLFILAVIFCGSATYVRKINDTKYKRALEYIVDNKKDAAIVLLEELGQYLDSSSILEEVKREVVLEKLSELVEPSSEDIYNLFQSYYTLK